MLHREHAATDSSSLIILFVVLLPQDSSGERVPDAKVRGHTTYPRQKTLGVRSADLICFRLPLRPYFASFMQVSTDVSSPTCCGELVFSRMAFLQLQRNVGPLLRLQSHWPEVEDSSSYRTVPVLKYWEKRELQILFVNVFIAQCPIPHLLSVFLGCPGRILLCVTWYKSSSCGEWNCSGCTQDELDFVITVIRLGQTKSLALLCHCLRKQCESRVYMTWSFPWQVRNGPRLKAAPGELCYMKNYFLFLF